MFGNREGKRKEKKIICLSNLCLVCKGKRNEKKNI